MTIRRATTDDLAVLMDLNDHVQSLHAAALPLLFRSSPPAAEVAAAFKRMIEDPMAVWLIAEEGCACGYLYAQFRNREKNWARPAFGVCNISHVAVHPDFRRRGVARSLVETILAEAQQRGFARIELDVWSSNAEARAAFGQLGFAVFNERMEYLGHPRLANEA
jgi:ribosomal protein S18 acetylase RimI-like enzyme